MILRKANPTAGPVDDLPDHLFRWLEATQRRLADEMRESAGSKELPLRGRQARLLQLIPPGGLRISDLAARAATTKQALGQLVDVLQQGGWVESARDPADARVRLVRRTARGEELGRRIDSLIADAESRLRAELGPEHYDRMMDALRVLGAGRL
ncbi:MAG: MarR family winged helix-turn-helix transcriptional regulator [Nakamurella sp.]